MELMLEPTEQLGTGNSDASNPFREYKVQSSYQMHPTYTHYWALTNNSRLITLPASSGFIELPELNP